MKRLLLRIGRDLGLIGGILWIVVVASAALGRLGPGFDAHAYWLTRSGDMYAQARLGTNDAYLYSPAFAQAMSPLTALPWPAFITIWSALIVVAYLWLTGPLAVPLLFLLPIPFEIHEANIHVFLAATIVLAERWPAAWAFGLLTKVTPGVGLAWYAVRREWRPLAVALGATAAVSALSFVLAPDAWREWFAILSASTAAEPVTPYLPIPLLPRLAASAALITWGAATSRRWVIPVGVTLALPVVWLNSLAVLLALVPSVRRRFGLDVSWLPRRPLAVPVPADTRLPGAS